LLVFRIFTVLLAPESVMVEVPFVKTLLAPLVSQLPETAQLPVVSVIVPLVPPVIVTSPTVTVEAFAVKTPPVPTVSEVNTNVAAPDAVVVPVSVNAPPLNVPDERVIVPEAVTVPKVTVDVLIASVPPEKVKAAPPVTLNPPVVSVPEMLRVLLISSAFN